LQSPGRWLLPGRGLLEGACIPSGPGATQGVKPLGCEPARS
jgi:hypothetical protein